MDYKYKVSVIVPVYNAEKYLVECLDSLRKQTLKEIEIICVNDGSTDKSLNIINDFINIYDNFVLVNRENGGVSAARVSGLEKASGEYIGWVDADDFVSIDMFEKLYNNAEQSNADVSICNYYFYPSEVINKKKWYKSYDGNLTWEFVNQNTVQWNKIIKIDLLLKLDIKNLFINIGEGSYSFVLINADNIVTIDEKLYYYRVGHDSLSSNFKKINWFIDTVDREKKKVLYVKENGYNDYWVNYFEYLLHYYFLILLIVSAYNNNKIQYNIAKANIEKYDLFSEKNKKYLMNNFSVIKILFFKYIGIKSFFFLKISSRLLLK